MNARDAMRDPALFGKWFSAPSWRAWQTIIAALYALTPRTSDRRRFRQLTGRTAWPSRPFGEAWIVAGRRGGKSRVAAFLAVYATLFRDWSGVLSPGERGVFMILAADKRQAKVAFRYVSAFVDGTPMLARMVEARTAEGITFTNGTAIEVHTASFRSVRGYTLLGAIADEIAFWRSDDSANPDREIVDALRPGMATVPGALLLGISSPYARRGVLWDAHRDHFGRDDSDVLVVKAPTRALNPLVSRSVVDRATERDPEAASAEYGAQFRRDIAAFLTREAVEGVVVPGCRELPPIAGVSYRAFVDPSGGSQDSMTLAVAHKSDDGRAVLDLVREVRPPFSPEQVVADFARELAPYRVSEVVGDRYGAEWVAEAFRKAGVTYTPAEKPKSDLYREMLPLVNSGEVELLDHDRLVAQLCGLERRTARGGRDSIDHGPGGHDDVANAAAGVLYLVGARNRRQTWEDLYGDGGLYYDEHGRPRREVEPEPDAGLPRGVMDAR